MAAGKKIGGSLLSKAGMAGLEKLTAGPPGSFNRGPSERAFQEQRAGERDLSAPSGPYFPPVTGNVPHPSFTPSGPDFSGVLETGTPVPGGYVIPDAGQSVSQLGTVGGAGGAANVAPGATGAAPTSGGGFSISPGGSYMLALQALAASGALGPEFSQGLKSIAAPATAMSGAVLGPVGMIAAAAMDSASELEQTAKLKSGRFNNPIKGRLYSGATEGIGRSNALLSARGSDLNAIPTDQLMQQVSELSNAILPYYATGQGGTKALRASDTITSGAPGAMPLDQYQGGNAAAKAGLEATVEELLRRGASYEDIGKIPVNPAWSSMSLDAGGAPWEYYARGADQYAKTMPSFTDVLSGNPSIVARGTTIDPNSREAYGPGDEYLGGNTQYYIRPPSPSDETGGRYSPWMYAGASDIGGLGTPLNKGAFTPENAFIAAMGAAGYDPDALTPQEFAKGKGGTPDVGAMQGVASMYGGGPWQALARMGSAKFAPLIQQKFDPWANWSTLTPEQKLTAMGPTVFGPTQMAAEASGLGSYGGRVDNPRIADFFAGISPDKLGEYTGIQPGAGLPAAGGPSGGAGSMDIGGVAAGAAGKRVPQFLTPELDNRAEAAAGKLGGGRPGTQDQGAPFGMSGQKRGGGFAVGGSGMGGRPGGNAPFGGMARQTMMPQQGGGVQARKNGQQGVV